MKLRKEDPDAKSDRVSAETGCADLPMAALAHAGGGFDWLAEEPELYSDADTSGRESSV